jgi:hypothetical protein
MVSCTPNAMAAANFKTETGGFGDHVVPYHSPSGTTAEWMKDPYGSGTVYTGPGMCTAGYLAPVH